MKQKLVSVKNFVEKHKTAIAVVGTAATCVYLQMKIAEQTNDRLKEIGAYEAFWADDEE